VGKSCLPYEVSRRAVWHKSAENSEVPTASVIRVAPTATASTSETSVNFRQTAWRNISADSHPHTQRRGGARENLKNSMELRSRCVLRCPMKAQRLTTDLQLNLVTKDDKGSNSLDIV
jgi:hypothetical protein